VVVREPIKIRTVKKSKSA